MSAPTPAAAVIGGGPAGLMAADLISAAGINVSIYDQMPSFGRKLLMAGRGGLNLTHTEDAEAFLARYGSGAAPLAASLAAFDSAGVRAWAAGLGVETFVGSTGRVFPVGMKASPLLRALLARLSARGVAFRPRHRWQGWSADGELVFRDGQGAQISVDGAGGAVLALGGASWPRLGSDGAWRPTLAAAGVAVSAFAASNCGVLVPWSPMFRERFAGVAIKNAAVDVGGDVRRGELIVTRGGLEGGPIYALGPALRSAGANKFIHIDLKPDLDEETVRRRLSVPRGRRTMSAFLERALALDPVARNLLREPDGALPDAPAAIAAHVKRLPLPLTGLAGLDRAISTAGGVTFGALDARFMLKARPGVFLAGEMLDWDAPTGGYLLQACFATGVTAAKGLLAWREERLR